jgi:hypothetical protein
MKTGKYRMTLASSAIVRLVKRSVFRTGPLALRRIQLNFGWKTRYLGLEHSTEHPGVRFNER